MINHNINTMRIVGASAIGPLHLKTATPCQDAFAYSILTSESAVIALADGLGSAFLSDFGARDAVDAAVLTVKRNLTADSIVSPELRNVLIEAAIVARKTLEEKTLIYQCKLRDLACTLIIIIINRDNVVVAQIGDGAVIAKTNEGLKLISAPGDSEYANEVSPLTGKDWEKSLHVSASRSGVSGIIAFTDGLQRAALKKTEESLIPFGRFCEPLFQYLSEIDDLKEAAADIKALLSSKKICDNSEDDKTLVMAMYKR
jgi:hypothetical protein